MKSKDALRGATAAALLVASLLAGCETLDSEGSAGYYSSDFNDPWYYGGYYDEGVIVTPPPGDRPHPSHPIARPPSAPPRPAPMPMPSIPSMPRPAMRGR
jgi:hypothetical protein